MPSQIDPTLIRCAQAGNATAMGQIFEAYQAVIFRYLYYRTRDEQMAEDLTAEVFLRAIKALPRYRQNGVPLKAWLLQISRNLAVDLFRRSRIRDHEELKDDLASEDQRPESAVEHSLLRTDLSAALGKLTLEQREVIILRFITKLPISQVAQVLNKNESAIKALQRRGLRALSKTLKEWNKPNE